MRYSFMLTSKGRLAVDLGGGRAVKVEHFCGRVARLATRQGLLHVPAQTLLLPTTQTWKDRLAVDPEGGCAVKVEYTQLKAQGPSRTCNGSKEEEESRPPPHHPSGWRWTWRERLPSRSSTPTPTAGSRSVHLAI